MEREVIARALTGAQRSDARLARFLLEGSQGTIAVEAFAVPQQSRDDKPVTILVLESASAMGKELLSGLPRQDGSDLELTSREHEVLHWLRQGYTNNEIAKELNISDQTVKKHVSSIMLKSSTANRTSLLARVFGAVA